MKNKLKIINGFLKSNFKESDLKNWSSLFSIVKLLTEKNIKYDQIDSKYLVENDYTTFVKKLIIKEIFNYSKSLKKDKEHNIRYSKKCEAKEFYKNLEERKRRIFKYSEPEKQEIETWIKDNFYYFNNHHFEINDDLSIDILYKRHMHVLFDLKYPINTVLGDFSYDINYDIYELKNLKNFPINIVGSLFLNKHNTLKFSEKYEKKNEYGWRERDRRLDDYQDFLENVDCVYAKEIIEKRKSVKKYRLICKDSSTNTYFIGDSNKLYAELRYEMLYSPWEYSDKNISDYSIEEDDNLYDQNTKWSEEEFFNRNSKEYIENKKIEDLKKQALSKLNETERELLGL